MLVKMKGVKMNRQKFQAGVFQFCMRNAVVIVACCLLLYVFVFANPLTICKDFFKPTIKTSASTVVSGIKRCGKIKVLRCVVGDFLDIPYHPKDREKATYKYQWEGSGEFCVDLEQITHKELRRENGELEMLILEVPKPTLENIISMDIPERCQIGWCKIGHSQELRQLKEHVLTFVDSAMRKKLNTENNIQKAKNQTEDLLRILYSPFVSNPKTQLSIRWK